MNKTTITRYIVTEGCDEWEEVLGIMHGPKLPSEGILTWTEGTRASFLTRKLAREAIQRTEHFRKAFSLKDLPEKAYCRVVPVRVEIEDHNTKEAE